MFVAEVSLPRMSGLFPLTPPLPDPGSEASPVAEGPVHEGSVAAEDRITLIEEVHSRVFFRVSVHVLGRYAVLDYPHQAGSV
jgi:hypothetical protein